MKTRKQILKQAKKQTNKQTNKQIRRPENTRKAITNKQGNPKPTCEMNKEATGN